MNQEAEIMIDLVKNKIESNLFFKIYSKVKLEMDNFKNERKRKIKEDVILNQ